MKKLLKNYLLIKWWFPLGLFGVALLLFLSGSILPETHVAFYFLVFSGLVLFISSIWQLLKGHKLLGFLQLSFLTVPLLLLAFVLYMTAGMFDKPDGKLTSEEIPSLIKEKTDLTIPKDYTVLENLIAHTEGSLDSDYSISLTIAYQESDEAFITKQVLDMIDTKTAKGVWESDILGFNFAPNNTKENHAESFDLNIDTMANTIRFGLIHL